MRSLEIDEKKYLVLVVGYDGTDPAQRALESVVDLLRDRPGRIEVVYVAHVPNAVALSPLAIPALQDGLDGEERDLSKRVEETLDLTDVKWHFHRRNGEIAHELLAAGREQQESEGPCTHVVLVLGGSADRVDRYLNSTPAKVIRRDRFEVFVVP